MTIDELIEALNVIKAEHGGQVPVKYIDPGHPERDVGNVIWFPKEKGGFKIWTGDIEPEDTYLPEMVRLS